MHFGLGGNLIQYVALDQKYIFKVSIVMVDSLHHRFDFGTPDFPKFIINFILLFVSKFMWKVYT